jgi:hypothetical protein
MLSERREVELIAHKVGCPIDVLFTQFSFASWIGNSDDEETQRRAVHEATKRIFKQTKVLKPKWVVPFASYVWFCHEENSYMNSMIKRVHEVVPLLSEETDAIPLVLYPGDRWAPGQSNDPTPSALLRYAADYESVPTRPLVHSSRVALNQLSQMADGLKNRLREFHGLPLTVSHCLGRIPRTKIWLTDYQQAVSFSLDGLRCVVGTPEDCDIAASSDALAYVLQNLFGGWTLIISGRFRVPNGGDLNVGGPPRNFSRYVTLADDASHGWPLRKEIVSRFIRCLPGRRGQDWLSRHVPS